MRFDSHINGCPCRVIVTCDEPRRTVLGRDPDDDFHDEGSFEVEVHWPRGGRAWALEGKMTEADWQRFYEEARS